MTPQKKKPSGFTSFRLIGRRAQDLLMKARGLGPKPPDSMPAIGLPEAENYPEVVVHMSLSSVVRSAFAILAIVAGTWLVIQLLDVIIVILLAFFVAAIIDPGVRLFERWGIPRSLAILVQYVVFLCFVIFLLVSLIPIIAKQLQQLAIFIGLQVDAFLADPHISLPLMGDDVNARLTEIAQAMVKDLSIDRFATNLQEFGQNLSTVAQSSLRFATQVAGSVLNFVVNAFIVLGLAFFIQMEREHVRRWVRGFLPFRYRAYLDGKADAIHHKIGQWARGQLALGFCIGLLVFVALQILGMPYALTLAVLAAFTEFIPYVGPFIAAIPSILIAGTQEGLLWALVVAAVYYVIQWCENNLLVPLIMKRAVGLSPIAVIVAMLVGVSFPDVIHPILGILISVPACTILALFLEDWRSSQKGD